MVPAASAAAVGVLTAVGVGVLLPAAGLVIAAGLVLAGVVAPAATAWAAHRAERRSAAVRGDVLARTLELLDGASDLLVFGAAARYRRASTTAGPAGRALRRAALARGLGSGLGVLAIGAMSARPPRSGSSPCATGTLPGPALAVLALTPLALADVVASLPDAAVRLLTAVPAARRLAELDTAAGPGDRSRPTRRRARRPGPHRRGASPCAGRDADRDAVQRRRPDSAAAPGWRSPGPRVPASRTWWRRSCARSTRLRAPLPPTAMTCGSWPPKTSAPASPGAGPAPTSSTAPCARTCSRRPDATDDELVAALGGPASAPGSPGCPTGSTRRSANTAGRSPAENANGSVWPAPCSPTARWLLDEPTAHLDAAPPTPSPPS